MVQEVLKDLTVQELLWNLTAQELVRYFQMIMHQV
jgi:hypothetical protein